MAKYLDEGSAQTIITKTKTGLNLKTNLSGATLSGELKAPSIEMGSNALGVANNIVEIGNGASVSNKANAFSVDSAGNVISSGDIGDANGNTFASIIRRLGSVYTPKGSIAFGSLPVPSSSNAGFVYDVISDGDFEIDNRFIEYAAGLTKTYPSHTNVAVVESVPGVYKFDVIPGFFNIDDVLREIEPIPIDDLDDVWGDDPYNPDVPDTPKLTMFLSGPDFKRKIIREMSTSPQSDNYAIEWVKNIKFVNYLPVNIEEYGVVVSIENSKYPIYAWYSDEGLTLNLGSVSEKMYLNPNSKQMFGRDMVNYDLDWFGVVEHFYGFDLIDTSKVTDMSCMFCHLVVGDSIDLRSFDTSNVVNMEDMFRWYGVNNYSTGSDGTSNPKAKDITINITGWDTSNVTNMQRMFTQASSGYATKDSIKDIIGIGGLNTSKVTNMKSIFSGLAGITSLDLHSWDTSSVTDMRYMFEDCINLKTIYVSNDFSTASLIDGNDSYMFAGCSKLVGGNGTIYDGNYVGIERACIDSPEKPGYLTKTPLVTATLKPGDVFGTMYGAPYWRYGLATAISYSPTLPEDLSNAIDVSASDSEVPVYVWADGSHYYYGSEADIIYMNPNSRELFNDQEQCVSIDLSHLDTSKVVDMSRMFRQCYALNSLDLSNFNTSNVTNMNSMFDGCTKIVSLDISSFDTSNVTNMDRMFRLNSKLQTIDVSSFDTSKVTDMGGMFMSNYELNTIYASNKFVTTNVTNSSYMFADCSKLVGGNGTTYSSSYMDKTYARIDASGTPGYFTAKS